jgi:polo-like kinase 1
MNEMIKRRKYLTEEETRLLMMQVVDAVTFMHDCNVIHRDLKLGNLFLSKTMNIKVGDFGLACRVDSTDEKRRIEGNKEKRGHSFEVDVWSMGVVCFTMLVGKPPYESTDVKSTYRRILSNEYSFPQGKVSGDARHLIASMLQTDPKMR